MLLQNYHELCNTDDPSSMFVSSPPITNIESLSQSTISYLDSGLFGRNRADVNIQLQTTSEVANTDKQGIVLLNIVIIYLVGGDVKIGSQGC